MNIAVSACLLGHNCKYNGKNNRHPGVCELAQKHTLIPVCPEMLGGLPCPRTPCEICNGQVKTKDGQDFSREYVQGAKKAMAIAQENQAEAAIVQPRSPSCGKDLVYDGTFSGTLTTGDGVFVSMLKEKGIPVISADTHLSCHDLDNVLKLNKKKISGGTS